MKKLVLLLFLIITPNIIISQTIGKTNSVRYGNIYYYPKEYDQTNGVYDYVKGKYISAFEYKKRYGETFYKDVVKLSKVMSYASKETKENFQKALKLRQISHEKNREVYNKLRRENLKYKRWGATLLFFSMATEIAIPIYIYKATETKTTVIEGKTTYTGNKIIISPTKTIEEDVSKIEKKSRAMVITSCIAGTGIITGICLIARYRSHKKQYDPGFCLANELYLQDCGLGISLTKKF